MFLCPDWLCGTRLSWMTYLCGPHKELHNQPTRPLVMPTYSTQLRKPVISICAPHVIVIGFGCHRTWHRKPFVLLCWVTQHRLICTVNIFGDHEINGSFITPNQCTYWPIVHQLWCISCHSVANQCFRKQFAICQCCSTNSSATVV